MTLKASPEFKHFVLELSPILGVQIILFRIQKNLKKALSNFGSPKTPFRSSKTLIVSPKTLILSPKTYI